MVPNIATLARVENSLVSDIQYIMQRKQQLSPLTLAGGYDAGEEEKRPCSQFFLSVERCARLSVCKC